jgi:glycosyltransferase involved in cell wall biosynthesis
MAPQVSIVLPCYNRVQYLRHAVDSVLTQTFQDWELIVADDGSGPETAGYLTELEKLPQLKVLRLKHSGSPSVVRNSALRAARGTYVAFLDSDDLWLPTKLERQIELHRSCAARRWSYVALERIHEDGSLMQGEPQRETPDGAIFEPLLRLVACVAISAVMVERELLEQVGSFDEAQPYFEEWDLYLRLSLHSDVSVVAQPLVRIRSHTEHYSANRVEVLTGRARLLAKIQPEAERLGLQVVLQQQRYENCANLARAYLVARRRREALRILWHAREGAWRQKHWWLACAAAVKTYAPAWVRMAYRKRRSARD